MVTAVLVSHEGGAWLPRTLASLAAQTRAPDTVVAVDTGSNDGSRHLLEEALGAHALLDAPPGTGYGAAVHAGLAQLAARAPSSRGVDPDLFLGPTEWIWLLHDDVELDPRALERLLAETGRDPSVGIAGPKVLGWYDRRLLLEVGVTIARSGRRETLLERREQDQGQHDGTRQVLAVSTAGMLVRRDVWDQLGGLDPRLPLLRDDVDLGWRATLAGHRVVCVTDAVAYHAEAAVHGRRRIAVRRGPVRRDDAALHRLDRQHAIRVLLYNLPLVELPVAVVRLALGSLVRAVGWLIGKLPGYALDELWAYGTVLLRPDRLAAARRSRRATRQGSSRAGHRYLAPRGSGWRHFMETVNLLVGPGPAAAAGGAHRAVETGPAPEEAEDLPSWGSGLVRRLLSRPGAALVAALALVTAVAAHGLYGAGRLIGGALLPAPDSAGAVWSTYVHVWHPVGLGSDTDAPPYLGGVALLGSLLLGSASLAVDLLLLGAVPLAGASAYLALRPVTRSTPLKVWAAATYALLPPVVGAVAAGRLSTAVVAVLLPVTARLAFRAVTGGPGQDRPGRRSGARDPGVPAWRAGNGRAAWGAGLLLAVMAGVAPMVYLVAFVLLVAAAVAARGRGLVRYVAVAVTPPLVLLPWLPALVHDPSLLLLEAGLPGPNLTDDPLPAWAPFLLHPGGPGLYPALVTSGLLLAALAALLRGQRRGVVLAGWGAALVGLLGALVQTRIAVTVGTLPAAVPAWAGPVLLVAGAGLLLAAVVGAEGSRVRLAARNFSWRQPTAVVLALVAGVVPLLAAGWWTVTGAGDPLGRRDPVLLPAFIAAAGAEAEQPRTLVIRPGADDRLAYVLLRAQGPRLGDADTADLDAGPSGLGRAVADLASGRGGDAATALLPYGVRFVLMTRPLDRTLARDVDAVPGLVRVSGPEGSLIWKVQYPSGRVRIITSRDADPTTARVVPAGEVDLDTTIGQGAAGRLLTVADRRSDGWRATLDGTALTPTTYDGWAQAFELPASGGRLRLSYDQGSRPTLLWLQAAAIMLFVVLVLPAARLRTTGADDQPVEPVEPEARVGVRRRT